MYEFQYDYEKPKLMEMENFLIWIQTASLLMEKHDIYKDIAKDIETWFGTSIFEIDKPLPKGKNKKVNGLMKDELDGQIMKTFVGLRAKTYSYLKDNNDEDKKAKRTKCVKKRKLKFWDYKKCLKAALIENKLFRKKNDVDCLKEE